MARLVWPRQSGLLLGVVVVVVSLLAARLEAAELNHEHHEDDAATTSDETSHQNTLIQFFLMTAAMFVGAFAAGYLPFLLQLSPERFKAINVVGAGVLLGTALIVIIPEGMHMMQAAQAQYAETLAQATTTEHLSETHEHQHELEHEHEHGHGHGHEHAAGEWIIGASITLGFALMLVVERLSGGHHSHEHQPAKRSLPTSGIEDSSSTANTAPPLTAFVGLVIHAFVDGVALGATAGQGHLDTSFLIFGAIMLHKAPAAFGLTTFLMQTSLKHRDVRRQLLLFAAAAPIGAVVTFYALSLGLFSYQLQSLAVVMLFSGGTFLFVSTMHILPEVMGHEPLSWGYTGLLVSSMLFPILINFEHGH